MFDQCTEPFRTKHFVASLNKINSQLHSRLSPTARNDVSSVSSPSHSSALPFPLVPKTPAPAHAPAHTHAHTHAMSRSVRRILNIVVSECSVLPSKEHCPLLIYAETATTDDMSSLAKPLSKSGQSVPHVQVVSSNKTRAWSKLSPLPTISSTLLSRGPSHTVETWPSKMLRIRTASPFSHLQGWKLKPFIVKSGSDLRREELVMQYISLFQRIFAIEGVGIVLKPYEILSTGADSGWIEFLEDSISIDQMKKAFIVNTSELASSGSNGQNTSASDSTLASHNRSKLDSDSRVANNLDQERRVPTIKEYFCHLYGPPHSPMHQQAISNFARSLAGYSLVTYLLQVMNE